MNLSSAQTESIAKYKKCAAKYDETCGPTQGIRRRAIDLLQLQPGQVVLDVGCGTGLSFEPLLEKIGPSGRILAFEQSPDMFELALKRAQTYPDFAQKPICAQMAQRAVAVVQSSTPCRSRHPK